MNEYFELLERKPIEGIVFLVIMILVGAVIRGFIKGIIKGVQKTKEP